MLRFASTVGADQIPTPEGPKLIARRELLPLSIGTPVIQVFHSCMPSRIRSATTLRDAVVDLNVTHRATLLINGLSGGNRQQRTRPHGQQEQEREALRGPTHIMAAEFMSRKRPIRYAVSKPKALTGPP